MELASDHCTLKLDTIFDMTDDDFINNVLVALRKQESEKLEVNCSTVLSLVNTWTTEQEKYVRRILHAVTENKFVVDIDFSYSNIPGIVLAEWINTNKTVTKISLCCGREHGIQDLANAIMNDTVIKNFVIWGIFLNHDTDIKTLSKAFNRNKSIESLSVLHFCKKHEFFFMEGISFNEHIQHLTVSFDSSIQRDPIILQPFTDALTKNTSITSLHLFIDGSEQPDPIVRGMIAMKKLKKVEFTIISIRNETLEAAEAVPVQSIPNMQRLEFLKIRFCRFTLLSDSLAKVLRDCHVSMQLEFDFNLTENDEVLLDHLINEISLWERPPQVTIKCLRPSEGLDFNWKILQKIQLKRLDARIKTVANLLALIDVLPNWNEVENLRLRFESEIAREVATNHHIKLAAAISDNYSIKNFEIIWNHGVHGDAKAEKWIQQSLRRNKFLSECQASTGAISNELVPALMEFTDDNPDFSFNFVKAHSGQLFQRKAIDTSDGEMMIE